VITLKGSVQVDRDELRSALVAVRPHAAPNKRGSDVLPPRIAVLLDKALAIVVLLNLTAIVVRNRLRRKYRTSAF